MSDLDQHVDRAAESARDADIDSQCNAPDWVITDADYPPVLNARPNTRVEIIIKYAAGITLAICAFVILGWVAGF